MKRTAYAAWCALKTSRQALVAGERLQQLTAQLNNPDLAKRVPEKALSDMPDFSLLHLCKRDNSIINSLLNSSDTLPVDLLLPSAQRVVCGGLTWFQVVTHTYGILTHCFWPPDMVTTLSSSLLPRIHTLTPSLHTEYHALVCFLNKHCPLFLSSCSLPSLPTSLLPPPPAHQGTTTAAGPHPLTAPPTNHLRASDGEVTVVWYTPPADSALLQHTSKMRRDTETSAGREELSKTTSESKTKQVTPTLTATNETTPSRPVHTRNGSHDMSCDGDIIFGVFGFNQRSVKPHPSSPAAVEVFTARLTASDLTQLRQMWQELSVAAKDYLDEHLSGRPISRSPSRLRKQAEKTQKIQAGLQVI